MAIQLSFGRFGPQERLRTTLEGTWLEGLVEKAFGMPRSGPEQVVNQ